MTHIRNRLDRLEAKRGSGTDAVPSVIFLAEAGGEVMAALFVGGGDGSRRDGESEQAFVERAMQRE